jgi:hypothetical protein
VNPLEVMVTLTSYAYETIRNKPIVAGKEHGSNDNRDGIMLERLARGASDGFAVCGEKQ